MTRRMAASGSLLVALTACARAPAPATVSTSPAPSPSAARSAEPSPDDAIYAALLCKARTPCRVLDSSVAARDAKGDLVVVKLGLFEGEHTEDEPPALDGDCSPFEYWLVHSSGGAATDATLLVSECNDGHGAAGVGEFETLTGDNAFSYTRSGGSSWRWTESKTLSLSPLRPRKESSSGNWSPDVHFYDMTWDWDELEGRENWFTPVCDDSAHEGPPLGGDSSTGYSYRSIPAITLDAAYDRSFATVDISACSASVNGAGEAGFVLQGTPGTPADASMDVVADVTRKLLYVTLRDDIFLPTDHLELSYSSEPLVEWGEHCIPRPKSRIRTVLIGLDGKVTPANRGITARVAEGTDGTRRFAIKQAVPTTYVSLAYSDSDRGIEEERLFATSRIIPDNPYSLGQLRDVPLSSASCVLKEGRLVPKFTMTYESSP